MKPFIREVAKFSQDTPKDKRESFDRAKSKLGIGVKIPFLLEALALSFVLPLGCEILKV